MILDVPSKIIVIYEPLPTQGRGFPVFLLREAP